jgi:hypothetical protein
MDEEQRLTSAEASVRDARRARVHPLQRRVEKKACLRAPRAHLFPFFSASPVQGPHEKLSCERSLAPEA